MISLRKSQQRGHADHGWLDSRHTFSFAGYYDPEQMGFSSLRVINDDRIAPGAGFPTHPHRDMEIVTYVLEGTLEHRDSMGNGSVIRPGEVQRMSAGTGIAHSEYNASRSESVHLLQIWIEPEQAGLPPGYEQRTFDPAHNRGRLLLVASPDGREGSLTIRQDAFLYAAVLECGQTVIHAPEPGRRAYLHVARGEAELNGMPAGPGDGAKISGEREVRLTARRDAEVLLFDLP